MESNEVRSVGPTPFDHATRMVGDEPARGAARHLVVANGTSSSWTFPLPWVGEVMVGRSENAGLRIDDVSVSRQHAQLRLEGDNVSIIDLGSHNGTYVNKIRITGRWPLHPGDTVTIQKTTLVLRDRLAMGTAPVLATGTSPVLAMGTAPGLAAGSVGATRAHGVVLGGQRVVVADPAVVRIYELVERLAPVDLPVLITGETGCGKELVATAIHTMSNRAKKPLVSLNCAALHDSLVESELFGHEKGSFSGAIATRAGLIEAASGSTLFLDEVGELAPTVQAKLLRVLEARRLTRVGDTREREVDVRVVAATNRDLEADVAAGRFRQDLFFRLSAATLYVPPLRQRPRELPLLAAAFLEEVCRRTGRSKMRISDGAMMALVEHAWPGNIRELKNLMQYLAATVSGEVLLGEHVRERTHRTASGAERRGDAMMMAERRPYSADARSAPSPGGRGGHLASVPARVGGQPDGEPWASSPSRRHRPETVGVAGDWSAEGDWTGPSSPMDPFDGARDGGHAPDPMGAAPTAPTYLPVGPFEPVPVLAYEPPERFATGSSDRWRAVSASGPVSETRSTAGAAGGQGSRRYSNAPTGVSHESVPRAMAVPGASLDGRPNAMVVPGAPHDGRSHTMTGSGASHDNRQRAVTEPGVPHDSQSRPDTAAAVLHDTRPHTMDGIPQAIHPRSERSSYVAWQGSSAMESAHQVCPAAAVTAPAASHVSRPHETAAPGGAHETRPHAAAARDVSHETRSHEMGVPQAMPSSSTSDVLVEAIDPRPETDPCASQRVDPAQLTGPRHPATGPYSTSQHREIDPRGATSAWEAFQARAVAEPVTSFRRRRGDEPVNVRTFRPLADEVRELEMLRIREALEATGGNQTRAAGLLAMPVRTFFEKAKQFGLTPKRRRVE